MDKVTYIGIFIIIVVACTIFPHPSPLSAHLPFPHVLLQFLLTEVGCILSLTTGFALNDCLQAGTRSRGFWNVLASATAVEIECPRVRLVVQGE